MTPAKGKLSMKTLTISTFAAGLVLLAFTANPARGQTNMNVSGNLQVSGTADFLNNTLTFGSLIGSGSTLSGVTFLFVDGTGTNAATLQMTSGRAAHQWLWANQPSSGSSAPMLLLDANNKLNLYSTVSGSTTPSMVFDPTAGTITINGQVIGGGAGMWTTDGSNVLFNSDGNVASAR